MRNPLNHGIRRGLRTAPAARQGGLTLIEFMVSIVIGMLMIAALATLMANQSTTRTEIDRSGKMIENGRYAVQTMANDIQMAGYWGELTAQPAVPAALPDPCSITPADLETAMGVPVQGYDAPSPLPATVAACVKNHKAGTDVLVVRRVEPDTSSVETAGATDLSKVVEGQVYLQTGLDALGTSLTAVLRAGSSDASVNAGNFTLTKKDKVSLAGLRKYIVNIYYISNCSVQVGTSCTGADGGNPIPTLKRVELTAAGGTTTFSTVSIAEGIENMQIDYGADSDNDGAPNGTDVNGSTFAVADWANVMSLKVYLLARSTDSSPGFQDTKVYALGTAGAASAAVADQAYKRHVFVQSVRLVNPASRRVL